jgi:hypothetical protein
MFWEVRYALRSIKSSATKEKTIVVPILSHTPFVAEKAQCVREKVGLPRFNGSKIVPRKENGNGWKRKRGNKRNHRDFMRRNEIYLYD